MKDRATQIIHANGYLLDAPATCILDGNYILLLLYLSDLYFYAKWVIIGLK